MGRVVTALLLPMAFGIPSTTAAQTVRVRVIAASTGEPVQGAMVVVGDPQESGDDHRQLSNSVGLAGFDVGPGAYRVEARMIGYWTGTLTGTEVRAGQVVEVSIALEVRPIAIEGMDVEAGERCRLGPEQGLQVAQVWDEVRKALEAARWTADRGIYRYRIEKRVRDVDERDGSVISDQWDRTGGYSPAPFESLPAAELASEGYIQPAPDGEGYVYYAPDAEVLLSDGFVAAHCMRLILGRGAREGWVGLTFDPVGDGSVPDISGTMWVDPGSWELRHLDYWYHDVPHDVPVRNVGGDVRFQRLPDGTWIIPEWTIRTPLLGRQRDMRGRERIFQVGIRERQGRLLSLRRQDGEILLTAGAGTIQGVVVDSTGTGVVAGATVELLGTGDGATSDGNGVFTFTGLAPGPYRVSLDHPELLAHDYEPRPVTVTVDEGVVVSLTLRLPSRTELLASMCSIDPRGEADASVGSIAGRVFDPASGLPLPGAVIGIAWGGSVGVEVTANEAGVYRACEVPRSTHLRMTARWEGFRGAGGTVRIPEDPAPVLHDLTVPVHGHAIIHGVVQESSTEVPVADARVRLEVDGEPSIEAVTDAHGRFLLDGAPAGQHRLTVSHPAYDGGGTSLATRPGERVEVAVGLPAVPHELRRLLPSFASRASTVTIDVVTRAMTPDGAEGFRRQR